MKKKEMTRWLRMGVVLVVVLVGGTAGWGQCPKADITGDCMVDIRDMALMASEWLVGTVPAEEIQWVTIPAGMFNMGDAFSEGNTDEKPVHTVLISKSFKMSVYEVTNAQYAAFLNLLNDYSMIKVVDGVVYDVNDSGNAQPWFNTSAANNESQIELKDGVFTVRKRDGLPQERHPVVHVSWYGAQAFCDNLGYQLPTEAQWEWAARGGLAGKRFSWGNENINHRRANYLSSSNISYEGGYPFATGTSPYTTPAGSFAPNGYGLFDMTGNVWEWCSDWYGAYSSSPQTQTNPLGPLSGGGRILRGGGWSNDAIACRVAHRGASIPDGHNSYFGFRVCQYAETEQVVIPVVTGLSQAAAELAIATAGLVEGTVSEAFSDTVAEGHIISQTPSGGGTLLAGSAVNLVVSKGPGQVATPVITPDGGSYSGSVSVSLSCSTTETTIRYTTNGSAPTSSSTVYSSPFTLDSSATVKAIAFKSGYTDSNVATAEFTIEPGMVWISINDPGVSGHEGFNGQMSKYETTNAQYCQFLNAALASGDIAFSGNDVIGASGSNSGADFAGQLYYDLADPGYTQDGATNGGAARINWTGSSFTVDSSFENHPVTYVSWYGATAFCNYYGWRLPTEWEWQAVADFNGSYTYGCGTTINNSIANCYGSSHPYGTTVVGAFGTYGYGMADMAGNVWEWTSTPNDSYRVFRGGGWSISDSSLFTVSHRDFNYPDLRYYDIGFRVCR